MKYIGNKTRLLDFITQSMKESGISFQGVFFDAFGGTGSVGRCMKEKGFEIISNDIMTYSYIIQYANVYLNEIPLFKKLGLGEAKDVIDYLNDIDGKEGYFYDNYAPSGKSGRQYFSNENAKKIDAIREKIQSWKEMRLIDKDEYYFLLSSLIDAADFVANISGTYGAYLKIWRSMALKSINLKLPNIVSNNRQNHIYREDINELINKVSCDVLYLDPPYNARQYSSNFHLLESLAVWDKQDLRGKTGLRNETNKLSKYCMKKGSLFVFQDLIKKAQSKYIILSYNNEGIMSREEIIRILKTKGELKEYTKEYRRFRTEKDNEHRKYKKCDDKVTEHLYIVKTYQQ